MILRIVRATIYKDFHTRWFVDGKETPNPYRREGWEALDLQEYLQWLKECGYSYELYEPKPLERWSPTPNKEESENPMKER